MSTPRTRVEAGEALLNYVRSGATQQTDAVMSVPVENYTDEKRWRLEIDRIFKKLPLILAWSAELPNPGDYKTMEVVGLPLLLARGADGQVRVFLNVCTHRGAMLAEAERGTCNRFTCGYHGWTFANDGRLIGVADREHFGAFDEKARGLTGLPAQERGGLIFALLTPGAEMNVEKFYGGMLSEVEGFDLSAWRYVGMRELPGPNWKIAFDGYIENYHFAVAHKNSLAAFVVPGIMSFDAFGPHVRVGAPTASILARMDAVPQTKWDTLEGDAYEFVRAIFPNTTVSVRPEFVHLTQIFPGATPGESRTMLTFLQPKAPANEQERARMDHLMNTVETILSTEDYRLNFGLQKGVQSGALKDVIFGRNEVANQFFHKWVDFYLQDNTPTAFPKL